MKTVNDLRAAIAKLPGTAPIMVSVSRDPLSPQRNVSRVIGVCDGRLGQALLLELGNFIEPFGAANTYLGDIKEGGDKVEDLLSEGRALVSSGDLDLTLFKSLYHKQFGRDTTLSDDDIIMLVMESEDDDELQIVEEMIKKEQS